MYEARRFRQVPVIYGSCTDEGTKNVDKTVTSQTLDAVLRKALGNMNDTQLDQIKNIYPQSLNNVSFSGAVLNATYPGAGNEWQRLAGKSVFASFVSDSIIESFAAYFPPFRRCHRC
jgi:hypothetical protein